MCCPVSCSIFQVDLKFPPLKSTHHFSVFSFKYFKNRIVVPRSSSIVGGPSRLDNRDLPSITGSMILPPPTLPESQKKISS